MGSEERGSTSIRGGVVWSLTSFVGTKAITFLATLVLARLLAPSEFGVLAAVLAFITLLELISDLGMKATVIYESERGVTARVQTAFTLNLLFTLVLTAVALALAPLIAEFFGVPDETGLFRLASLDLLLKGLGNIHDALLLRDMEFRRRIIPQLTSNVVRATATIALAVAGLGADALVIGFIVGTAVWTLTVWVIKPFRPTLRIERDAVRGIAAYGGWASALQILAAASQRADVAVIGATLGPRALGLYTVAQRVPELIVGNVTWNLSIVAFPALSQRRDQAGRALTDTTLNLIRFSALFGMTIGALLAVVAPPLIVVLFSEKWADAAGVMEALAIMYGLVCIAFPLGDTFKALGRQRLMAGVNALALPVAIGAMLLAAPEGVVAVAWARVAVTTAQAMVWIVLIGRVLGLRLSQVMAELRGGAAGAAGIVLAGLATRAAFPGEALGPLLLITAVSCVGGAVALRLFARREFEEVAGLVRATVVRRLRRRGRGVGSSPAPGEPATELVTPDARPRTRSE